MGQLTEEQADALANDLLGLAQGIGNFRYDNWASLSKEENQKLGDMQWSIMNAVEDITALSTTLVMDDIEDSLSKINDVSTEIKGTIQNLQDVQKGINIAASVVTLGAAIISKNPQSIASAISGVVDAWTT